MPLRILHRWSVRGLIVAAAAFLLSATLVRAALDPVAPDPARTVAGHLLVASPDMTDPRFARAVILMVTHDRNGAFGLVINRPAGEQRLADIFRALGEDASGLEGAVRIFIGGPVETQQGFVLHSGEYRVAGTYVVDNRFAMSASVDALRDMATNKGPKKALVAFGYSGWSPGQLESELERNAWFVVPADQRIVFDEDRDKVWDAAMARRPRDI